MNDDDDDVWLLNPPRKRRRRAAATTKRRATRRKSKRKIPNGFKSWKAYMASIRPSNKGASVAKRKRRRRAATTTKRRRRRNPVAVRSANPRRRRRSYAVARTRRRRRNPGFSVNNIMNQVKDGAIGAVAVVGGEAATRIIRSRVLGMTAGDTISSVAELGIATALGVLGSKFLGRQIGRDMLVGGYAGVLRATAKQLGVPLVSDALADEGGYNRFIVGRNGRVRPLNGYVQGGGMLNGYVDRNAVAVLGDEQEEELGY